MESVKHPFSIHRPSKSLHLLSKERFSELPYPVGEPVCNEYLSYDSKGWVR